MDNRSLNSTDTHSADGGSPLKQNAGTYTATFLRLIHLLLLFLIAFSQLLLFWWTESGSPVGMTITFPKQDLTEGTCCLRENDDDLNQEIEEPAQEADPQDNRGDQSIGRQEVSITAEGCQHHTVVEERQDINQQQAEQDWAEMLDFLVRHMEDFGIGNAGPVQESFHKDRFDWNKELWLVTCV